MRIISVVNYKGGVGKSTIVSNMGGMLALRGKKVLLIDLDPQASLTFSYMKVDEWHDNFKDKKTIKEWYDESLKRKKAISIKNFITNDLVANQRIINNGGKTIDLIPSHTNLYKTQIDLVRGTSEGIFSVGEKKMLEIISMLYEGVKVLKKYDYVIIDCQPSFDIITQSAIYASDYYLVPTKLDYLSTIGVKTLIEHVSNLERNVDSWVEKFKYGRKVNIKLLGVLPSMVKVRKNNIGEEVLVNLNESYKAQLENNNIKFLKSKIRANEREIDNDMGLPLVVINAGKNLKNVEIDFERLTDELLEKVI